MKKNSVLNNATAVMIQNAIAKKVEEAKALYPSFVKGVLGTYQVASMTLHVVEVDNSTSLRIQNNDGVWVWHNQIFKKKEERILLGGEKGRAQNLIMSLIEAEMSELITVTKADYVKQRVAAGIWGKKSLPKKVRPEQFDIDAVRRRKNAQVVQVQQAAE